MEETSEGYLVQAGPTLNLDQVAQLDHLIIKLQDFAKGSLILVWEK